MAREQQRQRQRAMRAFEVVERDRLCFDNLASGAFTDRALARVYRVRIIGVAAIEPPF